MSCRAGQVAEHYGGMADSPGRIEGRRPELACVLHSPRHAPSGQWFLEPPAHGSIHIHVQVHRRIGKHPFAASRCVHRTPFAGAPAFVGGFCAFAAQRSLPRHARP